MGPSPNYASSQKNLTEPTRSIHFRPCAWNYLIESRIVISKLSMHILSAHFKYQVSPHVSHLDVMSYHKSQDVSEEEKEKNIHSETFPYFRNVHLLLPHPNPNVHTHNAHFTRQDSQNTKVSYSSTSAYLYRTINSTVKGWYLYHESTYVLGYLQVHAFPVTTSTPWNP